MRSIYDSRYVETVSKLRMARERLGVSQADLSKRLGKPQSYISKIEIRERRIDLIETLDLCLALGIRIDAIVPLEFKHLLCIEGNQEHD